ncbi:glycoside hydrolase family 76 protein [Xylariales sp. AK1849]|nr:glycoside hydrolase family 76 protein [Xylariales sp. AK1849]
MLLSPLLYFMWLVPAVLAALEVDLASQESIRNAARQVADDLMTFYHGNEPGKIPGGALWGTMVDYWHYTGDETFNNQVSQALLFQVGPDKDYMTPNWTASLGNDDQAFWGMSALLAAETNFQDPPKDQPQWLALAQAVWNEQTSEDRRSSNVCDGGLRWQIYPSNQGRDYKNTIANGAFFNIGARLARYTNNDTYARWSSDTWHWLVDHGLIDEDYNVYDGIHTECCNDINHAQYSYSAAILLQGAANMYDYTKEDEKWKTRVEGLLTGIERVFFPNGTAFEVQCETPPSICNTDMMSYKGYTHRWLAVTSQLAPFTADRILTLLKSSTQAAVNQCTHGTNGRMCGFHWSTGIFDGRLGAGQQMDVVGALSSLLIQQAKVPVTNSTGGTSRGDPDAGSGKPPLAHMPRAITRGDKVGAAFMTLALAGGVLAMSLWMSWPEGMFWCHT